MQRFKLEDISPSRKGKHYRTLCFEISTPNCYFTQESLALDQFIQRLSMGEINFDWLITFFTVIKDWLYDIFIITRKNLRIRRRRYMAFILEMFAPIMIVSFLVRSNYTKALLRIGTFEITSTADIKAKIDTLEGFYDLGGHFDRDKIMNFTLCRQHNDPQNCRIGYIADQATSDAIFDTQLLKPVFSDTKFEHFKDENEVYECIQNPANCVKIGGKHDESEEEDAVVGFRGLVVFETSVNDAEVRYKIRLMEKHYGSLRHVIKTNRLYPSIYDRREYGRSYLESGFLALQSYIDKMIILHIKSQMNTPESAGIDFSKNSKCTCEVSLHETPHRQSDQFHDQEDPLEVSHDYKHDHNNLDIDDDEAEFVHTGLEDIKRADKVHKQSLIVSTLLVLSFTFVIPSEQRRVSSEKENGLTILLLVTGMTHRMQWLGNLLAITLSYMFPITVVTILLTSRFNEREGAVFEYVSGAVLWLLLFLYVMSLASLCYVTTVFFDKPMTSIAASVCFWVPSFLAPLYHIDYYYDLVPIWAILLVGLHPSIAVQTGLRVLIRFEKHQVPTDMFTLTRTIPTDPVKFIYIIFILSFDIILFMILAVYLDRVLKSKFGVSKNWYYIFKLTEYQMSSGKVAPTEMIKRTTEQPGHEPRSENAKASIITSDLTKKYGSVIALKNVNIELYHGEIFALLGQNGSGKSTLLNLFSGFTPATSGTAKICGYDITTHMVQIQEFTGICPQNSALYEDLTPKEHLLIFGRLRGLRGLEAKEQSMELMEKLRFQEMANWTTRKLSKGDKRKLSLAIALIGNPKVVLLDEPTGGLDYYSRRAVWDLLLKIRSNHTIIFSTHFMDEAELLGDRIGILSSGKMEVCGSTGFLRRHFGLGYSLKIRMDSETNPDSQEILHVVRGVMPNATLSTLRISPNASRLCICNLPLQDYSSTAMSSLFIVLARLKKSLGIEGFSVSTASVDEIFLTLSRLTNPTEEETPTINLDDENYNDDMHDELLEKLRTGRSKSFFHPLVQFHLLFNKKMLQAWRNRNLLIFQIVLPFMIFIIAILRISSHVDLHGRDAPPLEFSLDHYENAITLYHSSNSAFIKPHILSRVIGSSAQPAKSSDLSGDYIRLEYNVLRSRHVVGISAETGDKSEIYVHFTPYALHSAPLAINLYANTLVKYMDINRKITTINHPLLNPYFHGPNFEEDPYSPDLYAMLSTLAATTNVAFCMLFPLEERLAKVKHLQFMSGVRSCSYWLAIFCWDTLVISVQALFVIVFTFFYEPLKVFSQNRDIDQTGDGTMLIMGSFIYSGLMLAYVMTHFAHSKSGGFALYMSITILFGIILPFFILGVGVNHDHEVNHFLWLFRLFPPFALTSALRKFAVTLLGNGRCNHFTELGLRRYCKSASQYHTEKWSQTYRVSCCPNCRDFQGVSNCYDRKELLRTPWSKKTFYEHNDHHHEIVTHDVDARSIFPEVLSLVLIGVAFNILTIFLDSDSWAYLFSCICGERARAFQTDVDDDDVLVEMDKTSEVVKNKMMNTEALVVHNLCKSYGTYPALHNLSFMVKPGECFGIIGVNGAGKSTLFRVITGQSGQSYGDVYSVDCSLATKRSRFMQNIGFTTEQTGLLWSYMTCSENLVLLGRLRGLSRREAKDMAKELLKLMRLEHLDKLTLEEQSGGIRRRLTSLLAVVAEPPILILDEPTSSADPSTQRDYWELIKGMRKAGHTILFNSHRINECEELCHRVVILIDGKFQCIGSPRHLREKFGSGFKLLVKLIPGPAESQGYVSSLSDTIVKTFNPCTLRDRRRNVIQYVIHNADFAWDFLFQMMEHIKLRYNDLVEDYSFSNTTLEEVFLSFVILQNCGRLLDQRV